MQSAPDNNINGKQVAAAYGTGSTQSLIGRNHNIGFIAEDAHSEDSDGDDEDLGTQRGDNIFFQYVNVENKDEDLDNSGLEVRERNSGTDLPDFG